jgi:hypothetical protein
MSITPAELFKAKNFPKWISSHAIFKEVPRIHKVFPGIGLPNTTSDRKVDAIQAATASGKQLLASFEEALEKRATKLAAFGANHPKMGKARRAELDKLVELLRVVKNGIAENRDKCIGINKERVVISMPSDIVQAGAKRALFREGESLFRVFNKLNDQLKKPKFASMGKLENFATFKKFSLDNVPSQNFKVVFSSDGADGIWDVSTMSMRGVRSCQSWEGGEYKYGVIGSMIDPFVGIIYLTTGGKFNQYGSKMIKRCIVRFVVDAKAKKPYIALDNMYPSLDQNVLNQFLAFIKEKTGGKFEAHYAPSIYGKEIHTHSYMPLTKVRSDLQKYGQRGYNRQSIVAYQDIHFLNAKPVADEREALYEKNSVKKADKFVKHFSSAATAALKGLNTNSFPEYVRPAITMLKGEDKRYNYHAYTVPQLMQCIATEFVKTVKKEDFLNSDTYIRRVYYNYFNQKEKTFNGMKKKLVQSINGGLNLNAKNRLKSDHVLAILQIILSKTDTIMKDNLMKLVSKRKRYAPAPLPEPKPVKA